ncbi:MAG: riboflavin synthase [Elusimicrobia bacterium]|nr:riboflavin synthase [Elusimicrobiota bacterium]
MFSGIIERLGTVAARTASTLTVRADIPKPKLGASVAINGCCLTVVATKKGAHSFDVGPETWKRTNLGTLAKGDRVNVEPSLRLGDEVGGHFVTGHVDATAEILQVTPWTDGFKRFRAELPSPLRGLVAEKGSIAVDGVSLTVTAVGPRWFEIMLVPHTLERTTLGRARPSRRVNLEADPLARYAAAAAAAARRVR